MSLSITRATVDDVDTLAPLFDLYRVFYGQPSDPALARDFIRARLARGESVILLASAEGEAVGFTQLYPAFSSVGAARTWILNDLLVAPAAQALYRAMGWETYDGTQRFRLAL